MLWNAFVETIEERVGPVGHARLECGVRGTLHALWGCLGTDARARVAGRLDSDLLAIAQQSPYSGLETGDGFYSAIALDAQLPMGLAVEVGQVTLQAVAETCSREAMNAIRRELPEYLVALFQPPRPKRRVSVQRKYTPIAPDRSLAGARPGALQPLYDADPSSTGQTHSVASNQAPHSETKISSGRPDTPEHRDDSLSSGRPGSRTALADGRT